MRDKHIKEILEEGFEEEGTIEGAFDSLLECGIRDIFEMNDWDVPKFKTKIIPFRGVDYIVTIIEDGLCEATNDHRILYWKWTVTAK
jgi:hypothetical protein